MPKNAHYTNDIDGNLQCTSCLEFKPSDAFNKNLTTKRGFAYNCKDCKSKEQKRRRDDPNKKEQTHHFGREFERQKLRRLQDYSCAICFKDEEENKKELATDHSHVNGKSRGLLCHQCNVGLGMFKDNPELLEAAAKYLRGHNGS